MPMKVCPVGMRSKSANFNKPVAPERVEAGLGVENVSRIAICRVQ
jgi:hypothetical protein